MQSSHMRTHPGPFAVFKPFHSLVPIRHADHRAGPMSQIHCHGVAAFGGTIEFAQQFIVPGTLPKTVDKVDITSAVERNLPVPTWRRKIWKITERTNEKWRCAVIALQSFIRLQRGVSKLREEVDEGQVAVPVARNARY